MSMLIHFLGALTVILFYVLLGFLPLLLLVSLVFFIHKFLVLKTRKNMEKELEEIEDTYFYYSPSLQERIKQEHIFSKRVYGLLRSIPGNKKVLYNICFENQETRVLFPFVLLHENGLYFFFLLDEDILEGSMHNHEWVTSSKTIENPFIKYYRILENISKEYANYRIYFMAVAPFTCKITGTIRKRVLLESELFSKLCEEVVKSSFLLDRSAIDKLAKEFSKQGSDVLDMHIYYDEKEVA